MQKYEIWEKHPAAFLVLQILGLKLELELGQNIS